MSGSPGRIAAAIVWFVLFGATALLIGRSALGDWREGRIRRDGPSLLSAVEQWWLTAIAAVLALLTPAVLVLTA